MLRLAGTAIVWTFTSPNRFLRDYATKALRQLPDHRLAVLTALVEQFKDCDDVYVVERLAAVAHGSLLTAGHLDPEGALALARATRERFLEDEVVPNILFRDAVRGCFEWLLREGLIEQAEYDLAKPPYGSTKPMKPRTKKQLEKAYDRHLRDRKGNYTPSPYGSLLFSIFDHGDFSRYVIEPSVRRFTNLPLAKSVPKQEAAGPDISKLPGIHRCIYPKSCKAHPI